ncbi:hypothetical protein ABZS66_30795 [Dactylosporangium sp. NPDC005572]|uniref:hypothetical protein n=1 Tax=Dactylosporangium sp. NPDC005572 TaxID=3156889 RepID=UPI0033A1DDF1
MSIDEKSDARHAEPDLADRFPTDRSYVVGGRAWNDLLGGVVDALRIPPAYLSSLLGHPWTWLPPHHRYSEFGLLDVWRPARVLGFVADVVVPSMPATPPSFTPPLLPSIVERLFWHPTLVLQRGDHNNNYTAHPDEAWLFVNGIMTNDAVAQLNAAYLADLFHRPITLIQNATGGFVEDLLECALDKAWGWTRISEAATMTFPVLYDALKDPQRTRVVLIAHSQGTIIAGAVLRYLRRLDERRATAPAFRAAGPEPVYPDDAPLDLADFDPLEPSEIAKLEVYCFANCATAMRYVTTHQDTPVPWIESYGNEFDIVARLGVLAPDPTRRGVRIDGPRFKRERAWGHLLADHYLLGIEREQRKDRKRGPRTSTAAPYVLLNADRFPDQVPRLYQYLNGGKPPTESRLHTRGVP